MEFKKYMRYCSYVFLMLVLIVFSSSASFEYTSNNSSSKKTVLYFFYGQGCPHCAQMEPFLEEMQMKYPSLEIRKFEVYFNSENRELFQEIASAYGVKAKGVPSVFINNSFFEGYDKKISAELENKIKECSEGKCLSPEEILKDHSSPSKPVMVRESYAGLAVFFIMVVLSVFLSFYIFKQKNKRKKGNKK